MVPEGWSHTTFDKHVHCLTGFAFKSDGYSNCKSDIRLLRGDNIEPGSLRWRDAKFWPKQDWNDLDKYQLIDGDFVIALDRTWISSGLKVAELTRQDLPCLLVQRVARIRAKNSLEQGLLRQYFSSHRFEQYVKKVQTATAVPHISPNDIREFTVSLPPLKEQKKIVQILSTWDKAITTTEQLLVNSQQQKKALMQQLLTGKRRLLDQNGERFSSEWSFLTFDDAFKVVNKKSAQVKSSDYLATGSVPVVDQGKQLIAGYCDNDERYTNVPVIVFGDHTRCLKWVDFEFCPGADGTQVLDTEGDLNKKFGYYSLCFTDIPNLGYSRHMRELKEKDFRVPKNVEEQQKIAVVLSTVDQEITVLQQKLDALKQEKKALMQQLLTGKRRVKIN